MTRSTKNVAIAHWGVGVGYVVNDAVRGLYVLTEREAAVLRALGGSFRYVRDEDGLKLSLLGLAESAGKDSYRLTARGLELLNSKDTVA